MLFEVLPATNNGINEIPLKFNDERSLLQFILKGYEKAVRPVLNAQRAVVVKFRVTLMSIDELDEKHQVLSTNVRLDHEWTDEYVQWDPIDFGGIKSIIIPSELIWLPDVALHNK